jgi:nicotinic acid mononucleotide adenylyltransferase
MPSIDISSREIRRKVNRRESIRFLVPRAVEQVIVERKLYVVDREEISPADSTQSA